MRLHRIVCSASIATVVPCAHCPGLAGIRKIDGALGTEGPIDHASLAQCSWGLSFPIGEQQADEKGSARNLVKLTAFAAALAVFAFAAGASADVISLPNCAPWQDLVGRHSMGCASRACRTDAQCSGGHCYNTRRVCAVGTREVGPCASDGRCAEGECVELGTCAQ